MTLESMIIEMSEGVPGAIVALAQLMDKDVQDGFFKMLKLDSYGIYGSDIWDIFKRECGEDINRFIDVIAEKETKDIPSSEDIEGDEEGIYSGVRP